MKFQTPNKQPENRDPWLNPALASSAPVLYERSADEKAANAEHTREKTKSMRWDRVSSKIKLGILWFLVGLLLGGLGGIFVGLGM